MPRYNEPVAEVEATVSTSYDERSPDTFNLDLSYNCVDASGNTVLSCALAEKMPSTLPVAQVAADCANAGDSPSLSLTADDVATAPTSCWGRLRAWVMHAVETVMPFGGFVSSCFTLCTVTLGGGIIGMPSAFHTSGLVMGTIYLVVTTVLTCYSMAILGIAMEKTGLDSLENMARGLFGRGGDYFVGFVMWLSCVGTAIAYISGVSSCLSPMLTHEGAPEYLRTKSGNRLITSMIWLVFMTPLIIPKHVNSVRYVSAFSVLFIVFFVFAVVLHSCMNGFQDFGERKREIRLFNTNGAESIDGLSIFIFAFLCHGVCFPVYFEMRPKPSVKKLTKSTVIAMVVCMFFYLLAGLFPYFEFGAGVEGSILYNYDPIREPLMMIAYFGILIKLITAYVMNWVPVRNYIYYCIRWDLETLPYWRHIIVTTLVSTVVLVVGLFAPSIDVVFALTGSLCGSFIAFIFPALFWMYCGNWNLKSVGLFHYCMTYFLMIVGVIAFSFGTVACVYYTFFDKESDE